MLSNSITMVRNPKGSNQKRYLTKTGRTPRITACRDSGQIEIVGPGNRGTKKNEAKVDAQLAVVAHERDKQAAVIRVVDEPLFAANRLQLEKEAKEIAEKIEAFKKVPTVKKVHTWKTPISQALQTEELILSAKG